MLANAALVAASPDLYEALKNATDVLLAEFGSVTAPDNVALWSSPDAFAAYWRAEAALARARGEQP
jgi:hypothetical protein